MFCEKVLHKNQWHFPGRHSPCNAPRGSAPTRRAGNDAHQPRFVSLPWTWQPAAQRLPGERSSRRGRGGQGSTPFPEFPLSASGSKVHPRAAERWEFQGYKELSDSLPLNEESQFLALQEITALANCKLPIMQYCFTWLDCCILELVHKSVCVCVCNRCSARAAWRLGGSCGVLGTAGTAWSGL